MMTKATTDRDLAMCLQTLRSSGIIAYPTDTVWGLGCDATDTAAVEKLFAAKNRPQAKAMLLLASDLQMAARYVAAIPEEARRLAEESSSPLTIVYDGAHGISPRLIAADGSVAIRIPQDDFCKRLCSELGRPIVSTSANKAGHPTAACFGEIAADVLEECGYVCLSRRDEKPQSPPSQIIKITADGHLTRIR